MLGGGVKTIDLASMHDPKRETKPTSIADQEAATAKWSTQG
jgi:hypothetical protein